MEQILYAVKICRRFSTSVYAIRTKIKEQAWKNQNIKQTNSPKIIEKPLFHG